MATRSTIALEFADGSVGQVYCHWDGYLEHNGRILLENYQDPFKLRDLIDIGDLSILGAEIGEKHDFDNPHQYGSDAYNEWKEVNRGMCTFYGRDRNEQGVNARYFKDFADYRANHQYEEFEYILRNDGKWYVSDHGSDYKLLVIELAEEALV